MPILVLFAGLPGSGKSTLAHILAKLLGVNVVDIDLFKKQVGTKTDGLDPPEQRWRYYQLALDHILKLFENGEEMIFVDEMFHVACLRKRIEKILKERGISVLWIEVRCSEEDLRRRFTRPREGHVLTTPELMQIRRMVADVFDPFDPCDTDGQHRVVINTGPPEEVVERVRTLVHAH